MCEQEVVIWDTEPGEIVLHGDKRIMVERGDKLLAETADNGHLRFIERLEGSA